MVTIVGLIIIIFQLLMPDLVPDFINNVIKNGSQYVGVELLLEATLFL